MGASCFFVILFISLYPQLLSLLKMCPCCCIRKRHRDLVRPETIKVTRGGLHRHILCPAERELQSASCSSPHTWQLHHNTCSARLIPEKPRLRWRPTADPPPPPNTPSWVPPLIYYYWQTGITRHFTSQLLTSPRRVCCLGSHRTRWPQVLLHLQHTDFSDSFICSVIFKMSNLS